jgi:antitoxin component YwqK of YwqJK toxin-antitoxin module
MYDQAGQVSAQLRMRAGQIDGVATFFHEGRVVRRSQYRQGLLDGESTDYDGAGTVVQVMSYRANLLHGPVRRFWPDGRMMEEQSYQKGKPLAPPERFDAEGRRLAPGAATPSLLVRLESLFKG